MKRRDRIIQWFGAAVAIVAAVAVVYTLLYLTPTHPVVTQDELPEPASKDLVPIAQRLAARPESADLALAAPSLINFVSHVDALVLALGFQTPVRSLRDELNASGLSADAPAAVYIKLDSAENAPIQFVMRAHLAGEGKFEHWIAQTERVGPSPPPQEESHNGFNIRSGYPDNICWTRSGRETYFGNDPELLRDVIDARTDTNTDQFALPALAGADLYAAAAPDQIFGKLMAWPPWRFIAGAVFDPLWAQPSAINNAPVVLAVQHDGEIWRAQAQRPIHPELDAAYNPEIIHAAQWDSDLVMAAAGTPSQRDAQADFLRLLSKATHDNLTVAAAEQLIPLLNGAWAVSTPGEFVPDWSIVAGSESGGRTLHVIANVLPGIVPVEDAPANRLCTDKGVALCMGITKHHIVAAGSAVTVDNLTLDLQDQPALQAVPATIARFEATGDALQTVTRYATRLGMSDPAWEAIIRRIAAVESRVLRDTDRVTTACEIQFTAATD